MSKKDMSFMKPVRTDSDWHREIIDVKNTLVVIDVYNSTWGPCHSMDTFLENWFFDFSETKRLRFVRAQSDKVTPLNPPFFELVSSQPVLLFYLDGNEVGKIKGANLPMIEKEIAKAPAA